MGGTIAFADGQARSDDMNIDGPAAEIRIHGSADLRAETFDQHIEVPPKSGNLLTVAGAIAGGPVGAAVGRSEEHTSELQSLMRISYAVFCLKQKKQHTTTTQLPT